MLLEFVRAISELPDGARVPFRYFSLTDIHRERVTVVQIDRHWHEFKKATRNGKAFGFFFFLRPWSYICSPFTNKQTNTDSTGLWDFERFPPAKSQYQPKPATTSFITLGKVEGPSSVVIPSLVSIEFFVPFSIDGVHGTVVCGVSPQCISYYTV